MTPKQKVHRAILEQFRSLGRGPTREELVRALGWRDARDVSPLLDELEQDDAIYRDEDSGVIVAAYPYSAQPTRHLVICADVTKHWAMCAIDALGIPLMVKQDATVESVCPHSEEPVVITIAEGRLSSVRPSTVVVWRSDRKPCDTHDAMTCCPGTNFFSSDEALATWRQTRPAAPGQVLALPDALARSRALFASLLD